MLHRGLKWFLTAAFMPALFFCMVSAAVENGTELGRRSDFDDPAELSRSWQVFGMLLVPKADYKIIRKKDKADGVLRVRAKSASGVLVTNRFDVDPEKYPVIRWRWRVVAGVNVPQDSNDFDDQPAVVYIGDGPVVKRTAVGYRWETNTACGAENDWIYQGGMVTIHSVCLRNRHTAKGEWVVEEREYAKDFEKAFGRKLSKPFAVSIGANSQNSKSDTIAEIDYIEFLPSRSSGDAK